MTRKHTHKPTSDGTMMPHANPGLAQSYIQTDTTPPAKTDQSTHAAPRQIRECD